MTKFDTSKISEIAAITEQDWNVINQRAGWMLAPQPLGGLYYQQFADIPTLDQLLAVCQTWKETSWPLVVNVVTSTGQFAQRLADFFALVEKGGGSVETLEKLAADATAIKGDADQFNAQAGSFYTANHTADDSPQRHHYSTSFTFHDVSPVSDTVSTAAMAVVVGWGNIEDDMEQAITAMKGAEKGFGSFMSKVELETALEDWQEVVGKFQESLADMETTAGMLTGEAAYDAVPVEAGKTYHVRLDHPYEPSALAVDAGGNLVMATFDAGAANQQWRFTRNGYGWLFMSSADGSFSGKVADVGNNSPYLPCMSAGGQGSTGQNYRIVEVDNGSLRFVNLWVELETTEQLVLQNDAPRKGDPGILDWKPLLEDQEQFIQTWLFTSIS